MKTIGSMTVRYKSLPHQIRRVFERRNAQKTEFYGVRRFAKQIGIAGRNVTVTPCRGYDSGVWTVTNTYNIIMNCRRRL
jgi:hypothetical protein